MFGLRIVYKPLRNNLIAEYVIDNQPRPSKNFLTNQEIRDSIAASKLPVDYRLGHISIEVLNGSATWRQFFPFAKVEDRAFFTKKGISRILELKFLLELNSRFPSVKQIVHSKIVGLDRTRFLSRRGIIAPTNLKEYLAHLREEVGIKTAAHRKNVSLNVVYGRRNSLSRKRVAQRAGRLRGPYVRGK